MSEQAFIEELKKIGITLNDSQIIAFRKYATFLLEYNGHTNLTAIKDINGVYLKHFYDSLLLLKFKKLNNERVLDIGSGAGFPGVPLKIICPDIKLVVLDSNGKKTLFLSELRNRLNLDFTVVNDRAENYVKKERECFDVVTSRAVTTMSVLAELSLPFVKIGGQFIAYKGLLDETIENSLFAIETLGGKLAKCEKTFLPLENSIRCYVFVNKIYQTDINYPRLFDKIKKKPLQK